MWEGYSRVSGASLCGGGAWDVSELLGPREQGTLSKDPGIHLSGWVLEQNFSGHGNHVK